MEKIGAELPKKRRCSLPKKESCEFGYFIVRGFEEDIDHLIQNFNKIFNEKDKEFVTDGIFDLKGEGFSVSPSDMRKIIKEVPSTMVVGFLEDWNWRSETKLFYSKSGYTYVTALSYVSNFDPESECNRPAFEIYPTQSMSARFRHIQTGESMQFDYDFANYACSNDWENLELVTCIDNVYYILKKDEAM